MLISIDDFKQVYKHILSGVLEFDGKGCTIYILVSNDTDSLAALKIFQVSILLSPFTFFLHRPF